MTVGTMKDKGECSPKDVVTIRPVEILTGSEVACCFAVA
jgi:hypothetical protein